jgi:hypothetical protein
MKLLSLKIYISVLLVVSCLLLPQEYDLSYCDIVPNNTYYLELVCKQNFSGYIEIRIIYGSTYIYSPDIKFRVLPTNFNLKYIFPLRNEPVIGLNIIGETQSGSINIESIRIIDKNKNIIYQYTTHDSISNNNSKTYFIKQNTFLIKSKSNAWIFSNKYKNSSVVINDIKTFLNIKNVLISLLYNFAILFILYMIIILLNVSKPLNISKIVNHVILIAFVSLLLLNRTNVQLLYHSYYIYKLIS